MSDPVELPARKIAIWKKLLVAALALVPAVVALEATIRATDLWGISYHADVTRYFNEAIVLPPEAAHEGGRIFENAPDRALEFRTFRWRTDARGLRRPWDAPTTPDALHTVLFLGDSVTLAWGVDDEESWIRRLERRFDEELPGGVACLNAGHLRYDTPQAAAYLREHGAALAPDAVVLTFVTNDLEDSWAVFQELMAELAAPPATGLVAWSAKLPVWFRGTRSAWQVIQHKRADAAAEPVTDFTGAPGYAENWARCAAALDRLLANCKELGAPLVVLDHSVPRVPDLALWCEANGVPCEDFRFTDAEWARGLTNSVADKHANPLGNELLAEKAFRPVRDALR